MLGVCISRTRGFLQRISGGTKLSAGSCACLVKRARSMAYSIEERGSAYSMDYQVYFKKDEQYVSPFHDIPLYDDVRSKEEPVLNMVVEVPRWTNAKMEISRTETLNPIKQDVKKEKPRFVNNCFPYNGYIWNYGAFPQTWEDPTHTEPSTGAKGDNDPLDVLEIGGRVARRGEVLKVKVLGTMALIDEGETDWKILTIDVNDPLAEKLNDVCDIEKYMPGLLQATKEWFRIYKIPTGKPPNQFAFDGKAKDKEFAMKVVRETNQQWKALMSKSCDPGTINCANTTLTWSPYVISQEQARAVVKATPPPAPPHPIPTEVDKWYFFRDDKVVN